METSTKSRGGIGGVERGRERRCYGCVTAAFQSGEAKPDRGSSTTPSRVAYERRPNAKATMATPLTNSSISPTFSMPRRPGP